MARASVTDPAPRSGDGPIVRRTARLALLALLTSASIGAVSSGADPWTFTIDAAASSVTIHVGKAGVLGFAGHIHEVVAPALSGTVTVYPDGSQPSEVTITFDAGALRVVDKDEAASVVAEVRAVMLGPRVLDADRYPTIVYTSRRGIGALPVGDRGGKVAGLDGELTLHGVTKPVSCTVNYTIADQARTLTAYGAFTIRQTDFGIKPVTAAGGTIRVRDEVDVTFEILARR